mgnify:CR=1 FL=1
MLSQCEHSFCRDCLGGLVEVAIKDGSWAALVCPDMGCKKQLMPVDVQQIVPADRLEKYEEVMLQTALRTMSDLVYCPRPICRSPVIRADAADKLCICGSCSFVFCAMCFRSFHGPSDCRADSGIIREFMAADEDHRQQLEIMYGQATFRRALEEFASVEFLKSTSTKCPNCLTNVHKIEGCNKMHCSICDTNFCYLCGAKLGAIPYRHFDQDTSPCHMRLFD